MVYIKENFIKISLLGVLAALVVSLGFYATANAMSFGYFKGRSYSGNGTFVLPIKDGVAIPNYVDTIDEYIQFLKDKNKGNTQEKVGSAFIVCTMLGTISSICKSRGYIATDASRIVTA